MIPVEELHQKRWRKSRSYRKAYETLEDEFAVAHALLKARAEADLIQEEVVKRMQTPQSTIARLESGTSDPSLAVLSRCSRVIQPPPRTRSSW
ncbi:MAG: hypothetical protein M2R45_00697 [Verrucomicrobia subdivision 3 bacterium]|nr:hypothetical protein [Limisphaerales bacterium]MCS1414419.1 hypothetical protein [Limisphaerales bacterium]